MDELLKIIGKMGPAKIAAMAAVVAGIVLFFIFITTRLSTGEMSLLYADLSAQDKNAIVRELEALAVPYSIDEAQNRVLVSRKEVGRVRMVLAEKGLPDGGSVGYEIFDKESDLTTTSFKQNINQVRALEGELMRTIGTLKSIESSRVHLVLPRRELFSREAQPASASIFLKLAQGSKLESEQISAIQHLVAAAVPQLEPERVSIVDQFGNLLASGRKDTDATAQSLNFERLRLENEHRLNGAVEEIVGRIVGFGKVRANVSVDLDFDRITTNDEIFNPEGQVARSTQTSEENEQELNKQEDNVSVQNNLPNLPAGSAGGAEPSSNRNRVEEITNFEISKTVRQHIREGGDVKRMTVAVLIDGTYAKNAEGKIDYTPRTDEEIKKIEALVKSSIGFDDTRGDKIEVINMRFADAEAYLDQPVSDAVFMGLSKDDLFRLSETIVLAIVAALVILLVLRPLANRMLGQGQDDDDGVEDGLGGQAALGGPAAGTLLAELNGDGDDNEMMNLDSVDGKVKASAVRKVQEIIEQHPNETVSVIRSWLFQEG